MRTIHKYMAGLFLFGTMNLAACSNEAEEVVPHDRVGGVMKPLVQDTLGTSTGDPDNGNGGNGGNGTGGNGGGTGTGGNGGGTGGNGGGTGGNGNGDGGLVGTGDSGG